MSKLGLLLVAGFILVLVVLILATGNVHAAGDPDGGPHGIISALQL